MANTFWAYFSSGSKECTYFGTPVTQIQLTHRALQALQGSQQKCWDLPRCLTDSWLCLSVHCWEQEPVAPSTVQHSSERWSSKAERLTDGKLSDQQSCGHSVLGVRADKGQLQYRINAAAIYCVFFFPVPHFSFNRTKGSKLNIFIVRFYIRFMLTFSQCKTFKDKFQFVGYPD